MEPLTCERFLMMFILYFLTNYIHQPASHAIPFLPQYAWDYGDRQCPTHALLLSNDCTIREPTTIPRCSAPVSDVPYFYNDMI